MRRLLTTTAIVAGALWFHAPTAHAVIVDSFCGPQNVGGCGSGDKVFLNQAHGVTTITGNVGANNVGPGVVITSDHFMMLTITLDAGGGFATITPGGHANFFNGIDFSIPGYEFTSLIFSAQLQPTAGEATDAFNITGFRGLLAQRLADQVGPESGKTDTDQDFSITALSGAFDDVDIFSQSGFHEIKHIQVGGLCQILANGTCQPVIVDVPEPASIALMGVGLLGLGFVATRRRKAV